MLEKAQGRKGRLLDIGCGLGLFVRDAASLGWEAYGVDVDRDLTDYGRKTLNLNLHCGPLTTMRYPDGYFDVVTMHNLLDHLREPVVFLKEAKRILKDGGVIFINVHDAMGWKAKKYKENWGAYCPPAHLYYYSYEALKKLLNKACLRFFKVPGVNFKEGIKLLAVKSGDPRQESYLRGELEKIIYSLVQIFKL